MIGQMWEAGENVAQVGVGIDISAAAAFDDGVDDRATLTGTGFTDEEPVLFTDGGGADGIFHQVIVDLDASVAQVNIQGAPLAQGVIDGLAKQALRQIEPAGFEEEQGFVQSLQDWAALVRSNCLAQIRPSLDFSQGGFDPVEMLDLAHDPTGPSW